MSNPTDEPSPTAMVGDLLQWVMRPTPARLAAKVTSPDGMAADTIAAITSTDADLVAARLADTAKAINGGALEGIEGQLAAQATTLNAIFHRLTQYAFEEPRTAQAFSDYMKIALKAQSQSAHALETLGNLKQGPKVILARQLNAANQQIVNNHPPTDPSARIRSIKARLSRGAKDIQSSSTPESLPEPSPLPDHAALDTRSPREATPVDQPMESVDSFHRPAKRNRQTPEQPEC